MSHDAFTQAYIVCALWSSNDESNDRGGDPLDSNYDATDIAPETLATMVADCARFQAENAIDIDRAIAFPSVSYYDTSRAGHDFWLTRNGHGAGFWDRELGEVGARLSDASKAFGSFDLYIGDDGKIRGA
jgi:hypothetical protein